MGSLAPDSGSRWAHGPMVVSEVGAGGDLVVGHAGDNPGWHALIALHPASRDALIVLTNGDAGPALRQYLSRPWSALVGIDPLLPAFRPPAAIAVVGAVLEEGGGAGVVEYLRLQEEEGDAYDFGPRYFSWVADGLLEAGRAEDALELLSLGVDLHPSIADMWAMLAQANHALGDEDGARDACERALELAPGHPGASELKAQLR
jgi:tetratricopeptide (TPR) repeat protein